MPVGSPSSRPRPNVLFASNLLPLKPCGRGRAAAVETNASTKAIEIRLLMPSILMRFARGRLFCHNANCASSAHVAIRLDVGRGLWLGSDATEGCSDGA